MTLKGKGLNLIGQLLILSATICWGSSFIILKETIATVPALFVIGVRFLAAGLLLGVIFFKKIRKINRETFIRGIILGLVLSGAYITQTLGLKYVGAGKNAFITSLYCITCPFMIWMMFGVKPKSYHIISAVLCIVGIGLVMFSGSETDENVWLGCGLTFLCSIFYGLQIIFTSKFHEKKSDVIQLLVIQLFTVGVIVGVCSLAFELPFCGIEGYAAAADQIWRIVYLTLVCTLYTQLAQIIGLKFTESNQAAIILSLEAVFGVVFAILIGDERVTPILLTGFAVIFVATIVSELKIDVLRPFKSKKRLERENGTEKEEIE